MHKSIDTIGDSLVKGKVPPPNKVITEISRTALVAGVGVAVGGAVTGYYQKLDAERIAKGDKAVKSVVRVASRSCKVCRGRVRKTHS